MTRTRIAPSPTGYPHIGTIYQALFDWAYAKHNNGQFIVRIEDTDRARFVSDAEEKIFTSLDWFGLIEDESVRFGGSYGPYRQSERLDIYKKFALQLVKSGHAYFCFCTKEQLDEDRQVQQEQKHPIIMYSKRCRILTSEQIEEKEKTSQEFVIRLKVPENTKIVVHDEIRGDIEFDSQSVDDQVLLKSDGFPTYHLAVVVDDHEMEITDVVRGEEWIPSFPKHKLLYEFFGWEMPKFYHTPVLRNPDKSKLSKRHGHTSVEWYRENGFLPQAILNFLALMGWSHPKNPDLELFDLPEFVQEFKLKDLKPVGPIFDLKKLEWMNGEHIRQLNPTTLKQELLKFDPSLSDISEETLDKLILIAQTRIKTLKEFKELANPFINPVALELNEEEIGIRDALRKQLFNIQDWSTQEISTVIFENFIKNKKTNFKILYKILLGTDRGLPLADTFNAIGKEKTLKLFA